MSMDFKGFSPLEKEHWERYVAAMHGVQSAVTFDIAQKGEKDAGATPKHLRVGINSSLLTVNAIAVLLIDKGLITREEYLRAVADEAEAEVARHEDMYSGIKFA